MATYPIYSKIEGRDTEPVLVTEELTDWFGRWLSEHAPSDRPASLRDFLTSVLPEHTWVPFAIGDGTFLPYSEENKHIPRQLRLTIVSTPEISHRNSNFPQDALPGDIDRIASNAFRARNMTVCLVASSQFDSPTAFLQVASWDAGKRRLNFYQRARPGNSGYHSATPEAPSYEAADAPPPPPPVWHYFGSSFDAFSPDTAGRGPFCGHVNGSLVMKELSNPWRNWTSTRHTINAAFSPDDPIRREPLLGNNFRYVAVADRFEQITRNATLEWYNSRRDHDFGPRDNPHETPRNLVSWMRHVLTTTTVNIGGSSHNSDLVIAGQQNTNIPGGFFLNTAIEPLLPSGSGSIQGPSRVESKFYNEARIRLGLKTLYSWEPMGVAFQHEGQTPWCVIVPSVEDIQGINRLRAAGGLLSNSDLLAFLMVDFPNAVYSRRRESLLRYVPDTGADFVTGTTTLMDSILAAVQASAASKDPKSAEYEFLQNVSTPDSELAARVVSYMAKVRARAETQEGIDDYMLLAESRRRIFRPYPSSDSPDTNPLSEFAKTLPYATNIPQVWNFVEMTEDAQVRVLDALGQNYMKKKIAEKFMLDTPRKCHALAPDEAQGCPF